MASLKYATKAQLITAIREKFAIASGEELHRLAAKIDASLASGELTDIEMRNAFGKSVAQWATLKGKISSYAAAYNAMRNAKGE